MKKSVAALLEDIRFLGDHQLGVVEAIRSLIKHTIQPLTEEVKYGGIVFTSEVPFGGVFAHKEHVTVEFSHGASIEDPDGVLEGTGKGRRHIKLRSIEDISAKKLAKYARLALAVASAAAKGRP